MQIQCNHISKNYQSFQALKDVNFHVDSGAFFAMTGANGAGKSTLLDILIKRIPANQGTVLINHQDISKTDATISAILGLFSKNMLLNQGLYFWIGLFCGISFVFIYIDFQKEYVRFLLIYVCYLLSINIPYLIAVAFYQIDLAPLWFIHIFSIYFYKN